MSALFLEGAQTIGERLVAGALWHGDRCTWPGADGMEVLAGDLYEGTAGIAWFLAMLARFTGDPAVLQTARGAARHALDGQNLPPAPFRHGLHGGDPGALWAVRQVGREIGEAHLWEESERLLALRADAGDLLACGYGEVLSGAAGTLLALLDWGDGGVGRLDFAVRLGDELCARSRPAGVGVGWPGPTEAPGVEAMHVGLAHGASGAAWALCELYQATGERRFLETALSGFAFERAWHDRRAGAWRDPASGFLTSISWCRGSTGIGLARLRARELMADPRLDAEAGTVLAVAHAAIARCLSSGATLDSWEESNFSICHGMMGVVDLMLYAWRVLGVPEHRRAAERVAERGMQRARDTGAWLCGTADRVETAGLMLGLSGIGAVLLRLHKPDRLPPIGLLAYSTSRKSREGLLPAS